MNKIDKTDRKNGTKMNKKTGDISKLKDDKTEDRKDQIDESSGEESEMPGSNQLDQYLKFSRTSCGIDGTGYFSLGPVENNEIEVHEDGTIRVMHIALRGYGVFESRWTKRCGQLLEDAGDWEKFCESYIMNFVMRQLQPIVESQNWQNNGEYDRVFEFVWNLLVHQVGEVFMLVLAGGNLDDHGVDFCFSLEGLVGLQNGNCVGCYSAHEARVLGIQAILRRGLCLMIGVLLRILGYEPSKLLNMHLKG